MTLQVRAYLFPAASPTFLANRSKIHMVLFSISVCTVRYNKMHKVHMVAKKGNVLYLYDRIKSRRFKNQIHVVANVLYLYDRKKLKGCECLISRACIIVCSKVYIAFPSSRNHVGSIPSLPLSKAAC